MGASTSGTPPRPYAGCTSDPAWQRAGLSEAAVFDVYDIGDMLGSGAFGQVRACWPKGGDGKQRYAVKVVDTKSEIFRHAAAFLSARNEANILRLTRHPHIVELVDAFEKDRFLFLVMEHVGGGELFGNLADPCVPVTESCVGAVGHQLFQALKHLHELSVVHRDVKAENILLQSNPAKSGAWHIKLVDFGLATKVETASSCLFSMCREQEAPLEELICGTAYYCAPEVWINDFGPKVDVWAAGVVLYLALLGAFPFYDRDPNMVEVMICNVDLEPSYKAPCMQGLGYRISGLAKECLEALLVKDHEDRLSAAGALSHRWLKNAVRRASATEPDRLRRGSLLDRGIPFGRQAGRQPQRAQSELLGDPYGLVDGDQVIPFTVRSKAGRAAARAPVEPATERSRTAALEGLKARSPRELGMCKVGPAAHRISWRSQSRDIEVPQKDRDGLPLDTSLSDSDVEDAGAFCCR